MRSCAVWESAPLSLNSWEKRVAGGPDATRDADERGDPENEDEPAVAITERGPTTHGTGLQDFRGGNGTLRQSATDCHYDIV